MVLAEHESKQKLSLSESPSMSITINKSLSLTLSQQCSSSRTHMGSISHQAMQRGCYDEAKKHFAQSASKSKLGAQITTTAALIIQKVSLVVFVFFFFLFFLFCRQYDEAPGHTKVATVMIVVKSVNVFVGDSTVYYFNDSRER